jgi:hypothetical protein
LKDYADRQVFHSLQGQGYEERRRLLFRQSLGIVQALLDVLYKVRTPAPDLDHRNQNHPWIPVRMGLNIRHCEEYLTVRRSMENLNQVIASMADGKDIWKSLSQLTAARLPNLNDVSAMVPMMAFLNDRNYSLNRCSLPVCSL